MSRQIVFFARAAIAPPTYSQAVKAAGLVFVPGTPPVRQGAQIPVRIPGLKVSIAAIAEL